MKHKRSIISLALAAIVLVLLCPMCASTSVSAAPSSGSNVSDGLVGAPVGIVGAPAVCAQDAVSYDLFVRGTDNALWWRHQANGAWGAWKSLGGKLTSSPTAVARTAGVIVVNVRGANGGLWTTVTGDGGATWAQWYSPLAGNILEGTGPTSYCFGMDRIGVFVTGANHQLYHAWTDSAGRHGWENLGGYLTSSPSAGSVELTGTGGRIVQVAARGGSGECYIKESIQNTWYNWQNYGGQILAGTDPAIHVWQNSADSYATAFFVTGNNHQLWWRSPYNNWQSLGGYLKSSPNAASRAAGVVDVFCVGNNNGIWSRWAVIHVPVSWSPWYEIAG